MNMGTNHHLVLRVKSGWSNTFTHPTCLLGADREKFPFTFTIKPTSNLNNQRKSGILQLRYKTTTLETFRTDSTFYCNKSQRTNAVPSVRALKQAGQERITYTRNCHNFSLNASQKTALETVRNTAVSRTTKIQCGTASNVKKTLTVVVNFNGVKLFILRIMLHYGLFCTTISNFKHWDMVNELHQAGLITQLRTQNKL